MEDVDEFMKKRQATPDVDSFMATRSPDNKVERLLNRMQGGVSSQESTGRTDARNPDSGALGEFQVMPANVPSWTKKYLGTPLSTEEFHRNPDAQRKVFRGEMGKYLRTALSKAKGDENLAIRMGAAAWYGGEGAMHRYDDPTPQYYKGKAYPSFREYTAKILNKSTGTYPIGVDNPYPENNPIADLQTVPVEPATADGQWDDNAWNTESGTLLNAPTIAPQQSVIQPQQQPQTPDVPIDADKLLKNRDAVMAEAQAKGKQPVDILLEMARGEHPSQQPEQPETVRTDATDQDFLAANEYLKSVGRPEMTREQFEVAAKATGQQAQATGYQTQAQVPQPVKAAQPVKTTQTVRKDAKKSTQSNVARPTSGEVEVFRQNVKGTDKEQILREALSGLGVSASEADAGITKLKQAGKSNLLTGDPKQNSLLVLTDKDIEFFKNGKLTPQVEASLRQRVAENRTTAEALPENASFVGQYTKDGKTYRQGIPGTTDGEAPTVLQQIRGLSDNEVKKENTIWKYTFDPLYKQAVDIVGQVDGSAEDVDAEYQRLLANEDITKKQALEYGKQQGESYANDKSSRYGQARGTVASGIAGAGSEMVAYPAAIMRAINAISPEVASLGGRTLQNWLTNSSLAMAQAQATEADKNKDVVSSVIRMAGRAPGDLSRFAVSAMLPGGAALTFTKDAAITSFGQGNDTGQVFKDTGTGLATDILFRGAGKLAEAVTNKVASKLLAPEVREAIKAGALEAPYTGTDEAKRAFINTARRELVADTAGAVTRLGTIGAGAYTLAKLEGSETPGQDAAMLLLFDLAMHAKKLGQTAKLAGQIWRVPTEDAKAKPRDVMLLTEGGDKLSVYDVTGKYPDSMVEGVISRVPRADADRTAFEPRPMKGESARIVGGSVEYSKPKPAVWKNNDNDQPVTVTGEAGKFEGEQYYTIAESKTAIPANQLEFDKATFTETKAETTPVKKTAEVITENIPIVGTDVKKKTVNVKPAVEPVESEPVKQKIEEKVDEAWVNKILDPKGELTKEVEPKVAQAIEPKAEKGVEEKPVVGENGADKKSTVTVMDDRSPKSNWREKYDETPDLMGRHAILRAIADTSSDKEASDVLDRIKDEKYGNASNVAWDVAHNQKISQTTRDRAQKMYDAIYPPMTPEQRIETDRTNKQRLIKSMEAENAAMLAEANGKPKKAIREYIEGNNRRIAKAQSELQQLSISLPADKTTSQPIPMAERKALQAQGYTLAQQKKMSAEERAGLLQGELPDGTPMVRQLADGKTMRGTLVDNGTSIQLPKGAKVSVTNPVMKAKWKSESGQGLAMVANKGDYEQTKDVAGRIERGEQEIRRLNPEVERGRIAGGRRNVEATLILAADARASEKTNASRGTGVDSVSDTARRQEGILEKYAKQNDIWFKQGHFPDRLYIDKGGEAIVYRKDENRVVKLIDPRQIDKSLTPQTFLDNRIALFNYLFPESHYEVMGFMRDDNGKFRVIVTQPFIQGEPIKQQSDVDAFMKSKGLQRTGRQSYANDLYEVHDLHEKNVIKGKDGTIYVIDAVPKAKYVQDFEVVDKPKEDLAKSPTGKDLIEALDKPVAKEALQTAKSKVTQYGTEMDMTTAVIANRLAQDAGVMTVNFEGAFFEPESTKTFIASVRKLAKATNAKGLEKFANAVEHQFNKEGVAVVYMSPESARHETIHKADYLGAINKAYDGERGRYNGASEELKAYEPFQRFHRKLIELQLKYDEKAKQEIADKPLDEQTYIRHGVAMAEALAYLGDGHSAEFGLTENESIYILATLVEGYVKRNGVKALDNFKGDGLIYEIIDEARGKNDSGKGRDGSRSELSSEREARPETVERKSQEDVAEQEAEVKEPSVFTDNEVIRQLTGETVAQSNQKNRQFAETMAMNLMDVGQVPYDPQTFKGWASGAFNIIERNGVDKSIEIWRQMPMKDPETEGRRTALGTTIAIELYNQGRQDDLVPFGVELTTHVGNAAQELVAAKLMSRLSPVFASMQGDKYTLKAKKRVQTPEERAKTDRLAEKLQESADNHDVAEAAIAEAEQRLDEWAKQEVELNKLLDAERKRNADLETALEKAQQGMAVYKDSINDTTAKTPDRLKKLKNEITAEEPALLNLLRQKFGGGLAMALKGAPPVDSNLEEDAFDALIKLGAKQLIDGLPKGLTPQQFDTYLQHLTQGVLNATELNYIHAMAYEMTKPVRSAISAEKRALLDNRLAHARRAKTVLGMDSEQVLKQRKTTLERQIKNLEEQIETGTSPVKTTVADTPEITALKEKRDALKQQLPQYQTNNVVNRARSKAIQKQIERLQDQINGRQQVKAGKPKTNEEVEALKAQRNLLREQLGRLNKVQKREGRELASEKVKAGEAYRDDKFAHTMLDVANSLSASQEAVLMAFGLRETPELKKLKAIYEKAVPDGKEFNKALNEGKAILDQTYRAIEQQRDIAKYGKDKTPEEIRLLKIFKDDQRDAERLAQKELEHHFEQLKKSKIRQVGDAALSLWNLPRAIVFGGDAGWLVAQGGLPALLHTKAWAKSVKGVTPALEAPALKRWLGKEGANLKIKGYGIHIPGANVLSEGQGVVKTLRELVPNLDAQLSKYGFTGQSFERAITQFYDSEIRKQLEAHGTKFEVIGNVADFSENFMSELGKKFPLLRQTNLAHNLATDLMRLNIGEELFGKVDAMYNAGKLTADEMVAAKDALARKWVNVITGKGYTPGWTHGLFKWLAQAGSAPSLALSSFQVLHYTGNPIAYYNMPKGARAIVAKKAGRMYGSLAILFGILGAIPGLINRDPEDKDFGVMDFSVISPKLAGMKVNILRQLKEPVRLSLGLGLKKLYYAATGNKEGSARINDEWFQELVMNDYGGIGSFWKGKAHPSISYLNTLWTGKTFTGEPAGTLDYVPSPLILKEGVQSATYDKKANILKSGKSGYLDDNWARFLTTVMLNQIGFGANSYEAADTTTAQKQIKSMMTGDDRSETDKMQSQKANQYERLIREGFTKNDLENDMLADVRTGNLTPKQVVDLLDVYEDEIGRFQRKYGVNNLSDSQKQTLMANRRAFKILDYVWGGEPYKMDWNKVNAALKFATPAENKLNDREAQAIAEGIILEALLKSPKMSAPKKDSPYSVQADNPNRMKFLQKQK